MAPGHFVVRACLTCCAPLVGETLPGAWFYRQTQASHAVSLDRVEAGDGCRPIGMDDLAAPQKDLAGRGHSLGELALSHGHLASWPWLVAREGTGHLCR
jgi:hypothetical protein